MTLQLKLGSPITQGECDAALEYLALAGLPRSPVSAGDYPKVRALYFTMLRDEGVTGPMLKAACEAYIKRPTNGKAKYFPDPGQLLECCAEDARDRRHRLSALTVAAALLETPPDRTSEELVSLDRMREIRAAVERKVVSPRARQNPAPAEPRATIAEVRARVRREMKLEDVESPTSEQA